LLARFLTLNDFKLNGEDFLIPGYMPDFDKHFDIGIFISSLRLRENVNLMVPQIWIRGNQIQIKQACTEVTCCETMVSISIKRENA
jgi:hypothetical protein